MPRVIRDFTAQIEAFASAADGTRPPVAYTQRRPAYLPQRGCAGEVGILGACPIVEHVDELTG
jgi:hypothetical protein